MKWNLIDCCLNEIPKTHDLQAYKVAVWWKYKIPKLVLGNLNSWYEEDNIDKRSLFSKKRPKWEKNITLKVQ